MANLMTRMVKPSNARIKKLKFFSVCYIRMVSIKLGYVAQLKNATLF